MADWARPRGEAGLAAQRHTLMARLDAIERELACGPVAAAAEAAQWFQWEALKAQMVGVLSQGIAALLIDDAQILCQELWACEATVTTNPPLRRE